MSFAPHHILAAVALGADDEPAFAQATVDAALGLGRRFGARVTVLAISPPSTFEPLALGADMPSPMVDLMLASAGAETRQEEERLAAIGARCEAASFAVTTLLRTDAGPVANTVCAVAQEQNVDLVVVCTHGRKGLKRLVLGSVAEQVAHRSEVPVLLIRPPTTDAPHG